MASHRLADSSAGDVVATLTVDPPHKATASFYFIIKNARNARTLVCRFVLCAPFCEKNPFGRREFIVGMFFQIIEKLLVLWSHGSGARSSLLHAAKHLCVWVITLIDNTKRLSLWLDHAVVPKQSLADGFSDYGTFCRCSTSSRNNMRTRSGGSQWRCSWQSYRIFPNSPGTHRRCTAGRWSCK